MQAVLDFFRSEVASRKYIDLINQASSKWANWDPPHPIKAGDFGTINRRTGQFDWEGNIYADDSTADIATKYPPINAPAEKEFIVSSLNSRHIKIDSSANVNAANIANAAFSAQWRFEDTRGAFLVMYKPQMSEVPNELLTNLKNLRMDWLKDKMLVTEVFFCNAYALYLSNKRNETVKIALSADALVHPPVSAGFEAATAWKAEGVSGLLRQGFSYNETYTPLYLVKKIQPPPPRRRDEVGPNFPAEDDWREVDTPWDFLDEDGEDEIVE